MVDEETRDVTARSAGAPVNRYARRDPGVVEGEIAARDAGEDEPSSAATSADAAAEQGSAGSTDAGTEPSVAPSAEKPTRAGTRGFAAGALAGVIVSALAGVGAYSFLPSKSEFAEEANQVAALDAEVQRDKAALSAEVDRHGVAVANIEKRLSALESGAGASGFADVDKRVAALEAANSGSAARGAADAAKRLATPVADLNAQIDGARNDVQSLSGRVGKLESAAQANTAASDLSVLGARVDKIEGALAAPKSDARSASDNAAAIGIIAGAMEGKLAAGVPLAPELAVLQRLGVDEAELEPLNAVVNGAPTDAALADLFETVAPQVLAAATPPNDRGVVDRFLAHMRGLVRVRSLNGTESGGADPQALVSQIEAASRRGDTAHALAAFGKLPEAARKAAGDWPKEAAARQAADAALQSIRASAVGRLAAGAKP